MEPSELSVRLRYLNDSAHLLATTSPTASRYLMNRHNALMFDSKIELSQEQKTKACGACGTITTLGWEASSENDIQRKKRKGRLGSQVTKLPKAMVYSCGICSKKTRIPTGTSKPGRRSKVPLQSTTISTAPTPQAPSGETSNPPQKAAKRKQRKKGVLEAILARNHPQPSNTGFGLDLSDFMKKT
ncbi:hypothetical protein ONS95_002399 [Cadophora gregata]|uniref:uncharacterized protein n=1 Tax=Cadophora gregata TaxID=51156 RepID=UPI0026DC4054|nr:uncharacterized protein ONS95_002399 [Cadophora gregata]KAK0109720.1 hypothetical protein ONS95_002399 [Cadophora gregata]KAK0110648.1 hypothetical protein ONS96_002249 [Cadophora gregata f. sp. sojae]